MVLEKVKGIMDSGHLGEYSNMVEKLTQEDYTSLGCICFVKNGDG